MSYFVQAHQGHKGGDGVCIGQIREASCYNGQQLRQKVMTSDCEGSSLSETSISPCPPRLRQHWRTGSRKNVRRNWRNPIECYPLHVIDAFTKQGLLVKDQDSQRSSRDEEELWQPAPSWEVDGYYGIGSFFFRSVAIGRLPGIHPVIDPTLLLIRVALIGCGGLYFLKRGGGRIKSGRGMCWEC